MCLVFALLDVWQGMPMNYRPYTSATTLDQSAPRADNPARQTSYRPDRRLRRSQSAGAERAGHYRRRLRPSF